MSHSSQKIRILLKLIAIINLINEKKSIKHNFNNKTIATKLALDGIRRNFAEWHKQNNCAVNRIRATIFFLEKNEINCVQCCQILTKFLTLTFLEEGSSYFFTFGLIGKL